MSSTVRTAKLRILPDCNRTRILMPLRSPLAAGRQISYFDSELQSLKQLCHCGVETSSDNLECEESNFAPAALKV